MSKPSSGPTDRNFGLDHINGKGDKSRVTNVIAYRENFAEINWGSPRALVNIFEHCPPKSKLTLKDVAKLARRLAKLVQKDQPKLKTLREIEEAEHDWRMGL